MLLVLIILQFMPAPAKEAMAGAVRDQHSWQAVRTELEPQWTIVTGRIESRRPTITLVMPVTVQPVVDPRGFSFARDLPAGPRLASGLLRDVMTETAAADTDSAPAAGPVLAGYAAWDAPASSTGHAAPLLGDLRSFTAGPMIALTTDIDLPTPPTPPAAGGGPAGFPGSGIGSPVPEPSVISLIGIALPLILTRRRRWQNLAK